MATEHIPAELDKVGEILRLYAKALSGREVHLVCRGAAATRGAGWMTPANDGKALIIELPAKIARFPTEKENFDWYKVVLTHQAGHAEFGTFDFRFDRRSVGFVDWRPRLRQSRALEGLTSDWLQFLHLFPEPQLGQLIFDQVEDARVDAHMLGAYPGIRGLYRRVAQVALALRPQLELLPLREAFLEVARAGEPRRRSAAKRAGSAQVRCRFWIGRLGQSATARCDRRGFRGSGAAPV